MSNVKGIEIHDLFGLSEPLKKLIETVSGGIGKLYEPVHIKRMAKAEAEEIKIIGEKISDFNALPIKYDSGKVIIDGMDYSELAKRAKDRLVFQELKKQNNIENVVNYAAQDLSKEKVVSEQPVDIDWVTRFFDSVSDISSEDMQRIWGKILAGEVKEPGSFSLRTLQVIKNINKDEALLFEKIAPFVMSCYTDKEKTFFDSFLFRFRGSITNKCGIYFTDIMRLYDAGLLCVSDFIRVGFELMPKEKDCFFGYGKKIEVTNVGKKNFKILYSAYILTEAGKELLPIILLGKSTSTVKRYFEDCCNEIQKATGKNCKMEVVDCEADK